MTAKEYLNQARHLDALIHCRLREIDYWRDLSSSVSGSQFTCACCGRYFTAYGNNHRKYCSHGCYIAGRFGKKCGRNE